MFGPFDSLAVAGGWLWVAVGGQLDRVAPASGDITAETPIENARQVQVASATSSKSLCDLAASGRA
jgi:hypothetical protein